MCGIASLFSAKTIDYKYIKSMTDIIAYRGPDGEGHQQLYDGKVWLGHRRLSIVDLSSAGQQPMSYGGGRYWITYNGEVYNYLELRQELEKLGYHFYSNTDTEVVLVAYIEWGRECLRKFNGMWAFIIVDTLLHKVFVSRDRFGVKPLYYWQSPQGILAFASEIKEFTVLPGWKATMNGQRVYDYLNWGLTDHTKDTLFDGVSQLRGGQAVEFNIFDTMKELQVYQWYELKPREFKGNIQDAAEEFYELFVDSVRLRLRADVSIGSCLSGGIDSSSIVCVVNNLLKAQNAQELQKTVSACSDVKQYDEREFIYEIVNTRNIKAYYTFPNIDNLFKIIEDLTWHQDEPFGSTSIYAQRCVFEEAAQNGLKVMLDGQGADEQLAGYELFFSAKFRELFTTLRLFTLVQEIYACKKLRSYGLFSILQVLFSTMLPWEIRQAVKKTFFRNAFNPEWLRLEKLGVMMEEPYTMHNKLDNIYDLSYAQLTRNNLQMLLHWEDRNSMANSVETRLPFLDYRLVEFVLALPGEFKINRGVTKVILRKAMKGTLPEKVCMRMDKMGFVTPEEVWMKTNKELFALKIQDAIRLSHGIITDKAINSFEDFIDGRTKFTFLFWRLLSFGEWINKFKVGPSSK